MSGIIKMHGELRLKIASCMFSLRPFLILSLLRMFSFPKYVPHFRLSVSNIQCISYFQVRGSSPVHSIIPYCINLTILSLQYKSLRFSLRSFFHPPVTYTLIGQNTFRSTLISNSLTFCFSNRLSGQATLLYSA
jgi:hypothetical protein